MTAHTPTPWVVTGNESTPCITDQSGMDVAWPSRRKGYPSNANAAFIVRACNSHEALVEALRDLVSRCDGPEGVLPDGSNIDTLRAHAALSLAEAK